MAFQNGNNVLPETMDALGIPRGSHVRSITIEIPCRGVVVAHVTHLMTGEQLAAVREVIARNRQSAPESVRVEMGEAVDGYAGKFASDRPMTVMVPIEAAAEMILNQQVTRDGDHLTFSIPPSAPESDGLRLLTAVVDRFLARFNSRCNSGAVEQHAKEAWQEMKLADEMQKIVDVARDSPAP